MSTDSFYAALPTLEHFLDITNSQSFVSVPDDWYILISDIAGSTQAIAQGQYKVVNLLGASSIIAVLNAIDRQEVPFIFGGDGASILVPPSVLEPARQALLATRQCARDSFGMELRVGVVPVATIRAAGYALQVAKSRVTLHYSQASFAGGGLTYATHLVKAGTDPNPYRLDVNRSTSAADFSGLECRWQDIPSRQGSILSLIVSTRGSRSKSSDVIYAEVIKKIQEVCGGENGCHPVQNAPLNLSFNPKKLWAETNLRSSSPALGHRLIYLAKIFLENCLGYSLMWLKVRLGGVDWGNYKQEVAAATDYQKFDDLLRMVISSSSAQIVCLTDYLEKRFKESDLVYGMHISDRALMTCMVFSRDGHHTHFVDGADGGYALAAEAFKQRMRHKAVNWRTYINLAKLKKASS
ncbi:MAG: DUF3095 domain-containing protein [Drouetiella hepatica Uher 2000/2452]|jgi:hypothetical protein|uniref:DUF3095 domain-containing protein n=1 Tax=Drouetiella hepatica Uher 2000/2452 TaxID=904376 RepID=A0A951QB63_9CYAN|nr:DUF3095 domain-containing protein [Drouetiella hepatica Uher 2000/2452]